MVINRRDFVKLLGTTFAGFAIGSSAGALMRLPKSLEPVLYSGPRVESWKVTACSKCPGGCSLKIRLIDKFPVQAFGNPLSPINEGGICPLGLASISDLYHPSRLTSPLKKVNGRFVPITYKEAYNILLENLKKVINDNRQDDVFIIAQTESMIRTKLFYQFSKETGIKNLIIDNYLRNSISPYYDAANYAPDFIDFSKCDYFLNFGSQPTEVSVNPLYYTRKLIELRERGIKITNACSKLSSSFSKSDEWVPIQHNDLGKLALGIAYVLLKDETYDKTAEASIKDFASFKKYVLENYYPAKIEKSTGVPVNTILQIGRKFGRASAPVAYFDESILYASNGYQNALAVVALNSLKGFKGFGKLKNSFLTELFDNAKSDTDSITLNTFKKRLANNDIKVLMISNSNFIFNSNDQESLKRLIESIPFIVSFSPFIDESSSMANLIIPDHNDFEKMDLCFDESIGNSVISLQQPIVKPFFQTKDTSDLLISLIKDLGNISKFNFDSVSDYIKSIVNKVYLTGEGTLMNQSKFTEIEKGLLEIGWKTEQYGSFDDFWDEFLEYGGWWNPFSEKIPYTPKINFADNFTKLSEENSSINSSKNKFRMNIFRKNLDYKGNMSLYPVLVEQFGHNWSVYYELWVEINPETARSLSLFDRDKVFIKTLKGKFPAALIYNPAVMPGNLDVPFGLGHTILGDTSGINPLVFTENISDQFSGKPSYSETFVEIEQASSDDSFFTAERINQNQELQDNPQRSIYA